MTRSITIPLDLATGDCLNANQRHHWAVKCRKVHAIRSAAYFAAFRRVFNEPPYLRAHLVVTVGWPDKRRRDVANLSPTIKAAIDGIVDAGLIPDDSDAHLVGPDLRPYVAGEKGRVLLTFTFTELAEGEAA